MMQNQFLAPIEPKLIVEFGIRVTSLLLSFINKVE